MKLLMRTFAAVFVFRHPRGLPGDVAAGDCDGALSTTADSGGAGVLDIQSTADSTT